MSKMGTAKSVLVAAAAAAAAAATGARLLAAAGANVNAAWRESPSRWRLRAPWPSSSRWSDPLEPFSELPVPGCWQWRFIGKTEFVCHASHPGLVGRFERRACASVGVGGRQLSTAAHAVK